jgi:two-component system CitB family sensor kinase
MVRAVRTTFTGTAAARPPRLRLRDQVILLVTALVAATLVASVLIAAYVVRGIVQRQFEIRALTIARGVSLDTRYATWISTSPPSPNGPVQAEAQRVRAGTNAQYVVVADTSGTRYSHPDPARVGARINSDLTQVRAGRQVMAIDREATGNSATGSVPLRSADGRIVGTVTVGLAMSRVNDSVWSLTRKLVAGGIVVLLLGVAGAVALARRLRRTTHGLEPSEMADLLRGQQAILGGVRDGVIAIDPRGVVTACNDEAERVLGRQPLIGRPIGEAELPEAVQVLLSRTEPPVGEAIVIGDNTVRVTRLAVEHDGTDLGQVLVLRDHSDLDNIARELEATRALTDALRAQAHEHNNRIHALSGMLRLGHVEEAGEYLQELGSTTKWGERLADPYLAGLLTAKSAAASEAGVLLRLGDTTWVDERLTQPLDCITVVGNLVDNGIRAAAAGARDAWVEITLASDGQALVIHVVDSGAGVPAASRDEIFDTGFTTRDLRGFHRERHGLGLGLAQHTARRHRGDVTLVDPGSPGTHGAIFSARLEGVVGAPTTVGAP